MNLDDVIKPGVLMDIAQTIAVIALWLRRPGQEAGVKVGEVEGRVDVLEERIKHMPTTNELTELEGTVNAIKATLDGMQQSQDVQRATLIRIENYLLSHGRAK